MTAPAAISWAANLGWIDVSGTWLSFFANQWTAWILTVLAVLELIGDQLPSTPSRTVPLQFGTRIISGALSGAAILGVSGALAGALGAIIGTLGGRAVRARLAASFGSDPPAAYLEDAIAIGGALLIVLTLR